MGCAGGHQWTHTVDLSSPSLRYVFRPERCNALVQYNEEQRPFRDEEVEAINDAKATEIGVAECNAALLLPGGITLSMVISSSGRMYIEGVADTKWRRW